MCGRRLNTITAPGMRSPGGGGGRAAGRERVRLDARAGSTCASSVLPAVDVRSAVLQELEAQFLEVVLIQGYLEELPMCVRRCSAVAVTRVRLPVRRGGRAAGRERGALVVLMQPLPRVQKSATTAARVDCSRHGKSSRSARPRPCARELQLRASVRTRNCGRLAILESPPLSWQRLLPSRSTINKVSSSADT